MDFVSRLQSWDSFFRSASAGAAPGDAYQAPPSLAPPGRHQVPVTSLVPQLAAFAPAAAAGSFSADEKIVDDHLAVQAIIRSYQVRLILLAFTTFVHCRPSDSVDSIVHCLFVFCHPESRFEESSSATSMENK